MKDKPQRTLTKEFKHEAVQLVLTSGKSAVQIAKDLGVSDSALSRWVTLPRFYGSSASRVCWRTHERNENARFTANDRQLFCWLCGRRFEFANRLEMQKNL